MNNNRITELEQQLESIRTEIEKLKEEEKAKSEIKPWRAEYGTTYYCIDTNGKVNDFTDSRDPYDNCVYTFGNYYHTKGSAEQDVTNIALRGRVRQLRDIFCEGFIYGSHVFSVCFNTKTNRYIPFNCSGVNIVGSILFPSMSIAQQVCDILNKELENRIIKTVEM